MLSMMIGGDACVFCFVVVVLVFVVVGCGACCCAGVCGGWCGCAVVNPVFELDQSQFVFAAPIFGCGEKNDLVLVDEVM